MGSADEAGLIDLWEEVEEDPAFAHLRTKGIRLVPGIGSSRPLAMVVGEAPGATENTRGEPFCGASGQVLHQLMALAGLRAYWTGRQTGVRVPPGCAEGVEPNVWLTNAVKYRPPGNRTPTISEILAAQPYLRREWTLIGKPRLIVCVGSVAANTLNVHTPSYTLRGQIYPLRDGKTYVAYQYHPAYGLYGAEDVQETKRRMMEEQWEGMEKLIGEMKEELCWRG